MKSVFVVTGYELGWDCVVAVFDPDSVTEEQIRERFDEDDYCVHENFLFSDLTNFE